MDGSQATGYRIDSAKAVETLRSIEEAWSDPRADAPWVSTEVREPAKRVEDGAVESLRSQDVPGGSRVSTDDFQRIAEQGWPRTDVRGVSLPATRVGEKPDTERRRNPAPSSTR